MKKYDYLSLALFDLRELLTNKQLRGRPGRSRVKYGESIRHHRDCRHFNFRFSGSFVRAQGNHSLYAGNVRRVTSKKKKNQSVRSIVSSVE
jgi:hypothetical protein